MKPTKHKKSKPPKTPNIKKLKEKLRHLKEIHNNYWPAHTRSCIVFLALYHTLCAPLTEVTVKAQQNLFFCDLFYVPLAHDVLNFFYLVS